MTKMIDATNAPKSDISAQKRDDGAGKDENLSHIVANDPNPKQREDDVDGATIVDEYDIVHGKLDPKKLDDKERKLYDVQMSILEFELKHQKGIELQTDHITVPGRMSITLCSLLETLAIIIALCASFIHFAVYSRNYLLAVLVVAAVSFIQVVLYDSSYRTQRIALSVIQVIGLCIFMALVDWAFLDIIFNPQLAQQRKFLLIVATALYSFVPLLMILHVVFLGRGHRTLKVKRKTAPTQVIDPKAANPSAPKAANPSAPKTTNPSDSKAANPSVQKAQPKT